MVPTVQSQVDMADGEALSSIFFQDFMDTLREGMPGK